METTTSRKRSFPPTNAKDQNVKKVAQAGVVPEEHDDVLIKMSTNDNENQDFFQTTLNAFPVSSKMIKESCLPFAVIVKPFAPLTFGKPERTLRPFATDVIKCEKCSAFLTTLICCVCNFENIHSEYGIRKKLGKDDKPIPFYESEQQMREKTKRNKPAFVFVIEISRNSFKSGQNQLVVNRLNEILDFLPNDCHVGFMTYRINKISYLTFNPENMESKTINNPVDQALELIVSRFFVSKTLAKSVTTPIFDTLRTITKEHHENSANLQNVVGAGYKTLVKGNRMGKLIVLHSSDVTSFGETNDFGNLFINDGVSIDLFLFNDDKQLDMTLVSQFAEMTGGQVYKYSDAKDPGNEEQFMWEMKANLSRSICFGSSFQVIATPGIKVTVNGTLRMGTVDTNRAVAIELTMDDTVKEISDPSINLQTIFTYISRQGNRKDRVRNYSIRTCDNWNELYSRCNPDAIFTFLIKQNLRNQDCVNIVLQRVTDILRQWQNNGEKDNVVWKNLALYTNCFLRTQEATMKETDKILFISSIMTFGVAETVHHFYPKLHSLSGLQQICTKAKAEGLCAFMIANGFNLYFCLYDIGSKEMESWFLNNFGTTNLLTITTDSIYEKLVKPNSNASKSLRLQIKNLREEETNHLRYKKLVVLKRGPEMDEILDRLFIRDEDYSVPGLEEPPQAIQLSQDIEMPPHRQVLPANGSQPKKNSWFAYAMQSYYTTIFEQSKIPWTEQEKAHLLKLAAIDKPLVGTIEEFEARSNEEQMKDKTTKQNTEK